MFIRISRAAILAGFFAVVPRLDAKPLPETELRTVEKVELNRYTGTWHETARYPNRFQKDCVSDTTAAYTLREDGKINVVNSCLTKERKRKTARGTARVADKKTNAKLKVTFFWPFSGNYWVIALDPEYKYAVVGEPNRKYLWILSRTPALDDDIYRKILDQIREAGYDASKLLKTPQSASSS